jgi:hypothetical protein
VEERSGLVIRVGMPGRRREGREGATLLRARYQLVINNDGCHQYSTIRAGVFSLHHEELLLAMLKPRVDLWIT